MRARPRRSSTGCWRRGRRRPRHQRRRRSRLRRPRRRSSRGHGPVAGIDGSARPPREAAASRAAAPAPRAPREPALVTLAAVRRERLADAVRVTIELDREVPYYSERIPGPDRVFVDLPRTRAVPALKAAVLPFADDVVRRVRVGAQPGPATRVVLDLDASGRHSVYTLYNPYRIVIDVERVRPTRPCAAARHRPAAKPALVPIVSAPAAPTGRRPSCLRPRRHRPRRAPTRPSPPHRWSQRQIAAPAPAPATEIRPAAPRPVLERASAERAASAAAIAAAPPRHRPSTRRRRPRPR